MELYRDGHNSKSCFEIVGEISHLPEQMIGLISRAGLMKQYQQGLVD